MSGFFKQDLPPNGGYPPIHIERMRSRRTINNFSIFCFGIVLSLYTIRTSRNKRFQRNLRNLEITNAMIAMEPFIEAERDRLYLKNLILLRDEEASTMAKYPDWTVGSLFGQKRYRTLPPDASPNAEIHEYWMFRPARNRLDYIFPDRHFV